MLARILLVGAGGIGTEIANCIGLSKLDCILTIIDYDTVSMSNLNRQFLFATQDIGKPKATILSANIHNRYAINCNPIITDITKHNEIEFFSSFTVIISAVDNNESRIHINQYAMLCGIPYINTGSSGEHANAQLIIKGVTRCLNCYPTSVISKTFYPYCTIQSKPTRYEHCALWAKHFYYHAVMHEKQLDIEGDVHNVDALIADCFRAEDYELVKSKILETSGKKYDKDDDDVIKAVHAFAISRAAKFSIKYPVHCNETLRVIESIIPSISTTNSLVGALAVKMICSLQSKLITKDMFIASCNIIAKAPQTPNCSCKYCHSMLISIKSEENQYLHIIFNGVSNYQIYKESILVFDSAYEQEFPNYKCLKPSDLKPLFEVSIAGQWKIYYL